MSQTIHISPDPANRNRREIQREWSVMLDNVEFEVAGRDY